jgi:hypothetical protein
MKLAHIRVKTGDGRLLLVINARGLTWSAVLKIVGSSYEQLWSNLHLAP